MRLKSEHVSMNEAIELGSLEIRKLFKDLNPTALDKKVNVDYLEKELGLKRFFPQSVIDSHKVCYSKIFKKIFQLISFLAKSPSKMY
jgi:focal adhesion kinase 1